MRFSPIILLFSWSALTAHAADLYLPFEYETVGTTVTTAIVTNGTIGPVGPVFGWSNQGGTTFTVSDAEFAILTPFDISGVSYPDTNGTRGVYHDDDFDNTYLRYTMPSYRGEISVGCYIKFGGAADSKDMNHLYIGGGGLYAVSSYVDGGSPTLTIETTSNDGEHISVQNNVLYWICIKYSASSQKAYLHCYNGTNGVFIGGSTNVLGGTDTANQVTIGRRDAHGSSNAGLTYFDDLVIDWTNGHFPLGIATNNAVSPRYRVGTMIVTTVRQL